LTIPGNAASPPAHDLAQIRVVRVGTRGSMLARRQADLAADALAAVGIPSTIDVIVTAGDTRAPDTAWGEGAFVGAIEAGLIDGTIDIAVHSAKDLPTAEEPRLRIAAYLPRADPRDVLVFRPGSPTGADDERALVSPLDRLPAGARVGTDSPRRTGFLRAIRSDLQFHPLHGNVDTRLRRLDEGATDALVLAAAGLDRLGRSDRITAHISADLLPPAPGQGALAIQVRASDSELAGRLASIDHAPTRVTVEAERALLAATGGGCRTPVGALATVTGTHLELLAGFASANLPTALVVRSSGDLDRRDDVVRAALLRLADAATRALDGSGCPGVIVTGGEDSTAATRLALVDRGICPIEVPAIAVELDAGGELEQLIRDGSPWDWIVVASANAVRALSAAARATGGELRVAAALRGASWAAVGRSTAAALSAAGIHVDHRPLTASSAALGSDVPIAPGARVLVPRSDLADDALPRTLAERGADVRQVVAYRTFEAPATSRDLLRRALKRRPAAIVLSSASALRGLLQLGAETGTADMLRALPLVAIGASTAAELRRFGLQPAAIATTAGPGGLADATALAIKARAEIP
jgi:hydroxymethylbilane synthase